MIGLFLLILVVDNYKVTYNMENNEKPIAPPDDTTFAVILMISGLISYGIGLLGGLIGLLLVNMGKEHYTKGNYKEAYKQAELGRGLMFIFTLATVVGVKFVFDDISDWFNNLWRF